MQTIIYDLPFKLALEGFTWTGSYILEPYEPAEENCQALMPYCTVTSLFIEESTKNVYDVIDPRIIHIIEQHLVKEATP